MSQQRILPFMLAIAAAIPAISQAQPPLTAAVPQIKVPHRDLDLTDARDVRILHNRIRRTAERLCANAGARDLNSQQAVRDCVNGTIADAARAEAQAVAQAETNAAAVREAMALARR